MKQYSTEFNAGQIGMVLVQGNISGDIDDGDPTNDDPAGRLQQIEVLEKNLNTVNQTTAVSIVFLMKSVGVGFNASGTPLYELVNQSFVPRTSRIRLKFYLTKKSTKMPVSGIC